MTCAGDRNEAGRRCWRCGVTSDNVAGNRLVCPHRADAVYVAHSDIVGDADEDVGDVFFGDVAADGIPFQIIGVGAHLELNAR